MVSESESEELSNKQTKVWWLLVISTFTRTVYYVDIAQMKQSLQSKVRKVHELSISQEWYIRFAQGAHIFARSNFPFSFWSNMTSETLGNQ